MFQNRKFLVKILFHNDLAKYRIKVFKLNKVFTNILSPQDLDNGF